MKSEGGAGIGLEDISYRRSDYAFQSHRLHIFFVISELTKDFFCVPPQGVVNLYSFFLAASILAAISLSVSFG